MTKETTSVSHHKFPWPLIYHILNDVIESSHAQEGQDE